MKENNIKKAYKSSKNIYDDTLTCTNRLPGLFRGYAYASPNQI